MIETFAVAVILALFAGFLIFTFLSYVALLLNLIILIVLYFLIINDLRSRDNHKYYLMSLLLTAVFFISSSSSTGIVSHFLALTERMTLSALTVSVIAVYAFSHLIAFVYEYYCHLKEKHRR